MNIFNKKAQTDIKLELPLNPIMLYQTCPFKKEYAYLRGIQEEVLKTWHGKRNQKDTICKMPTGSGKTLTGLLMLFSKLIEKKLPCLFVCPDNQLVKQTIEQANLYGIPVCAFEGNSFPLDFSNNKKILVCSFQKLFNGKSIFKRDNIKLGAIVLDDAHKCVDIAREQSTIKLLRSHIISTSLFELFKDSLEHQLLGTYFRLEGCDPTMFMKVPYWTWMDNHKQIIRIINNYVSPIEDDFENDEQIKFSWKFAENNLLTYDCYIGGEFIEISPIHVPYFEIPSFNEAEHRFILSATFEDDYDLIKDLGISFESINNPIIPEDRKELGKRLILAPNRFAPDLPENDIRKLVASYPSNNYNTVVLVPSKAKAKYWLELGATYVDKNNIQDALKELQSSTGKFMVFGNRYDGIDLYNDLCRILVIDGLPIFTTLVEQYTEIRLDSMKASRKAQIIEQGLGRATRSGGDFSVIYLMGLDLLNFIGQEKNLQYFTSITRRQLEIGLNLLDGESTEDPIKTLKESADFCLCEDKSWLNYHSQQIIEMPLDQGDNRKKERLLFAEVERNALELFRARDYENSSNKIITGILQKDSITKKEKAWYYQMAAQLMFLGNRVDSNGLQDKANKLSTHMFYPQNIKVEYRIIVNKHTQAAEVKKYIKNFETSQDFINRINQILMDLKYSTLIDSKKFEKSLKDLGELLGFISEMPEEETGNGPDVLWSLTNGHYLILEAKSEAIHKEISRENVTQLQHSETWFKKYYASFPYNLVTLQKPNKKGNNVNITPLMRVIDQEGLDKLHNNLKQFGNSFLGHSPNSLTEKDIASYLVAYRLTPELILTAYIKEIKNR